MQPVKDLAAFEKLYNDSVRRKDGHVLLEIQRERQVFDAALEVNDYPATTESSE
jgi:hypothetical protein